MKNEEISLQQEVLIDIIKDRKANRRWKNIRFFAWMIILLLFAFLIFGHPGKSYISGNKPYVALIRLDGEIMPDSAISAETIIPELNSAFRDKKAKGVVLLINSPGGSAVQASLIHDKILQLKKKFNKKVVVVGEDALASGAYLIATAADKIYVNKDTLTGSIGVVMSGFGFDEAIKKIGISRRLFTAGEHKDRLDPFEKLDDNDVKKIKDLLTEVHQDFINDVLQGRGNHLQDDKTALFSGDFWTGQTALKLGLVDGTENIWTALEKEFQVEVYHDYSAHRNLFTHFFRKMRSELNLGFSNRVALREQAF